MTDACAGLGGRFQTEPDGTGIGTGNTLKSLDNSRGSSGSTAEPRVMRVQAYAQGRARICEGLALEPWNQRNVSI